MSNNSSLSILIKEAAIRLGFFKCGFSKAEALDEDGELLKKWLSQNHHAGMTYMENHFEKRIDPVKLHAPAKSVISVLYNYYPQKILPESDNYKISKYAYGKDYHFVVKDKLNQLLEIIEDLSGSRDARIFVDSAPVLDRRWAQKSGLGWIGKNSCLITKEQGSFFFVGEIIIDLELEYDSPINEYCGSCTKCLNACPTNALIAPNRLDARKCISYHTIENKEEIPEKFKNHFEDWIFGCDICQDVCPWNKKAVSNNEIEFQPSDDLMQMRKGDWNNLDKETFNLLFKNSPIKRSKYEGLFRNITFVKK